MQTFINLGINPNTTCIENALWANPANFDLGTYIKGADGQGVGTNPTVLGAYNLSGTPAANANALDFAWVQDLSANANINGVVGSGPSRRDNLGSRRSGEPGSGFCLRRPRARAGRGAGKHRVALQ